MGNFSLDGIIIDGVETVSTAGTLTNISIPAGAPYAFKVSYNPRNSVSPHTAVLDITWAQPRGVHQIHLDGTVLSADTTDCVTFDEGEEVGFDGTLTLTVNRLVAATSKVASALSSDDARGGFTPVAIPITLSIADREAILPEITAETNFFLPQPVEEVQPLGRCLTQGTLITTTGDASGTYDPSTGSIMIDDLIVTLDTDFYTTIEITLTTDRIALASLPARLNNDAVGEFGDAHYSAGMSPLPSDDEIFGSRIDAETGTLALVGTSVIESSTLDDGGCDLTRPSAMQGAVLAILIEGQLSAVTPQ